MNVPDSVTSSRQGSPWIRSAVLPAFRVCVAKPLAPSNEDGTEAVVGSSHLAWSDGDSGGWGFGTESSVAQNLEKRFKQMILSRIDLADLDDARGAPVDKGDHVSKGNG